VSKIELVGLHGELPPDRLLHVLALHLVSFAQKANRGGEQMGWVLLVVAILLEVAGTTNMKLSEGFSKPVPSVLVLFFYALSIIALTFAVNRLDVSVAYAVWSGMGTALVAMIGLWISQESITAIKLVALGFIVVGVAMLHLTTESS
jgi:small multidrug resistance pump